MPCCGSCVALTSLAVSGNSSQPPLCFNFGVFVFVLIYNLYLLDRGYREDFIGLMNGAFTAGSVAGALPAGAILQRLGIAFAFRFCILFTALIFALRALLPGEASIIGFAFCGGSAFALWAVTIAPAIAQLTTERTRARGFSLFFAISITIGVVGGVVGGRYQHGCPWRSPLSRPRRPNRLHSLQRPASHF